MIGLPLSLCLECHLTQAMKATVKGYRDVVHNVLGYKIELLPDSGMCALRSIYAEKPDDVVKLKVRVYKFFGISSQLLLCLFRFTVGRERQCASD